MGCCDSRPKFEEQTEVTPGGRRSVQAPREAVYNRETKKQGCIWCPNEAQVKLACNHHACEACLKENFIVKTNLHNQDQLNCPQCNQPVAQNIIHKVFGGSDNYQKLVKRYKFYLQSAAQFYCWMDQRIHSQNEKFDTQCGHMICISCVIELFTSRGQLKCPICNTQLNQNTINQYLGSIQNHQQQANNAPHGLEAFLQNLRF